MFKVNNKNTKMRCEIRSKLTIKIPKLLTFNYFTPCSSISIFNFEEVNARWVMISTSKNSFPLIHFRTVFLFYIPFFRTVFTFCTPRKYQKTRGLLFSGGREWEHLPEIDYLHNGHKYNDSNLDKK